VPWARAGGIALAIGGLLWIAKGAAILAGGPQPPVTFEAAPFFFAVGLLGFARFLARRPDAAASERLRRAATVPTSSAVALGAVTAVAAVASSGDDTPALFDVTLGLSALAVVVSLIVLGLSARRTLRAPTPLRHLPLAIGVLFVPSILLGGLLSAASERLLELPIVLLGLAFVVFGATLAAPRVDVERR